MARRVKLAAAFQCAAVAFAAVISLCAAASDPSSTYSVFSERAVGIDVHWRAAPGEGRRPAIIALHGCSGLYTPSGKAFDARYLEYTALFNAAGWHVVLPDSFGKRSICATPDHERDIRVEGRRADVLATLKWLQARDDVDPARIAIVGWSHGATTALNAINAGRTVYARPVAGAAAFYPGCSELQAWPFRVSTPVLMMLGEKDDWTRPEPCVSLGELARPRNPADPFDIIVYPDSHHGFDSTRPVRFRTGVANGKGAHAGGNPAAREASRKVLMEFLTKVLQ